MKFTHMASLATKIIAALVFVLLVTVLAIPDYSLAGTQSYQDKTEVTASTAHNHTQLPHGHAAHESHRL
jgi:hypothetical protein